MMAFGRRMRGSRVLLAAGLAVVVALGAFGAARCPMEKPVGYGILEFAGRADARAMDADVALGVNPLFTWAELEPAPGAYNWAPLDEVLASAHAKGRKVAPRIYTNAGDFDQATPGWVFQSGAAAYTLGDGSGMPQPVPTDPVFTAAFGAFVDALGARYNGNPDIEFIQTNAGMGAYGEMVWSLDVSAIDGFDPGQVIGTIEYWVDRWRAAFPGTHLALLQNFIGQGIAEEVTGYAVDRGYYLQSNSPEQSPQAAEILAANDGRTKIVLEIENRGCNGATGEGFSAMADRLSSYGFAVDYLVVCGDTLDDAGASRRAYDLLRKGG